MWALTGALIPCLPLKPLSVAPSLPPLAQLYTQLVSCLYVSPKNLALGRPARQSSVYDSLSAGIAVDGDRSGDDYRKCNCTQQDPQGWWEVDLGEVVHIHQVKVLQTQKSKATVFFFARSVDLEVAFRLFYIFRI